MKILIEGQSYPIHELKSIFNDSFFYNQRGDVAIVNCVGYYYSTLRKEVVYMLPKVFMSDSSLNQIELTDGISPQWNKNFTVFKKPNSIGNLSVEELYKIDRLEGSIKHDIQLQWIRHITISFYNSLIEFKSRHFSTQLMNSGLTNELNTNIGQDEYSYLDIVLSFINFYKKNKSIIIFKKIEQRSDEIKKVKWDKTIRKSLPLINKKNHPLYIKLNNKKSYKNSEEELIIYFLSILYHLKEENNLNITIDESYNLIKGNSFEKLQYNGVHLLKKIRYRYFSDLMKRMYRLCELYFDSNDKASIRKRNEEFISINKYNIVFEDMVEKLLSDDNTLYNYDRKIANKGFSINKLKNNKDGKIIDHLFEFESLIDIDRTNIFYIGDSKYYKPGNLADNLSIYKQFTYAKNIIQFNIDLFNNKIELSNNLRYRDKYTEGYNITPNFLLYGFIKDHKDFVKHHLSTVDSVKESIKSSFHWETRLFDRDSLFLCQFKINYLFVLNSYTEMSQSKIDEFRKNVKEIVKQNFIEYFSSNRVSNFKFYHFQSPLLKSFVIDYFKILNGNCISYDDLKSIIVAVHNEDKIKGADLMRKIINNKKVLNTYQITIKPFKFKNSISPKKYEVNYYDMGTSTNIAADIKRKYGK